MPKIKLQYVDKPLISSQPRPWNVLQYLIVFQLLWLRVTELSCSYCYTL